MTVADEVRIRATDGEVYEPLWVAPGTQVCHGGRVWTANQLLLAPEVESIAPEVVAGWLRDGYVTKTSPHAAD